MYCLIQFYFQLRVDLAPHRPFLKVAAIKLVIFLSFWQSFLISILTSSTLHVVKVTSKLAYPDLIVGIPNLLICIEMALFSILHLFAFPWKPYRQGAQATEYPLSPTSSLNKSGSNQGGFLGTSALMDAMNPWDLVKGFARGMRWLFVGVKNRENDSSYKTPSFNNPSNENDLVLDPTSTDSSYKNTYTGTTNLPIAEEFRRSKFGLPGFTKLEDEQHAGLIAHAQPNPLNPGSGAYIPARQRYDANGQDISQGSGVYTEQSSPDRLVGQNPTPGTVRRHEQAADIGVAVSAPSTRPPEVSPYQSHFQESQSIHEATSPMAANAYRQQPRRQDQRDGANRPPPQQQQSQAPPEIHNALWGQPPQRQNEF